MLYTSVLITRVTIEAHGWLRPTDMEVWKTEQVFQDLLQGYHPNVLRYRYSVKRRKNLPKVIQELSYTIIEIQYDS